jgi:TetR/AcrR family transcriptional repressor of lmrAB and yxaGH operons
MASARKHRENLVRSAMRLFRRQGYAATGLQQILALSGAPKGSLYHYFPGGKEAIGEAAVELAGRLAADSLEQLAARHRSPEAFVAAYCRQYATWMEESDFRSGCPIATTVLETAPLSARITAAAQGAIERWIEIVAAVFARAGTGPRAARERAELTVAAVEGALILARVARSAEPILAVGRALSGPGRPRPRRRTA